MTEQETAFVEMVSKHDLTFDYSDDFRCWKAGNASLAAIHEAAKSLPRDFVVETWNAAVDKKIVPGRREQWYWKETV
jgi:hypothetical protein